MDVLVIEPEMIPRIESIGDDLKSLQQVVGGLIEATYPYDDPVAIICNEEGKNLGLPLNRRLESYDIIAGTFIICGLSEDNFDSLTPELMNKYYNKFFQPELFLRVGNKMVGIPMEPEDLLNTLDPSILLQGSNSKLVQDQSYT